MGHALIDTIWTFQQAALGKPQAVVQKEAQDESKHKSGAGLKQHHLKNRAQLPSWMLLLYRPSHSNFSGRKSLQNITFLL